MSKEHFETLKEFDEFIKTAASDYKSGVMGDIDPSDYAFEVADGSQYAIYYSHAWDLVEAVRALREDDLIAAEMDYSDLFPPQDGADFDLDKIMTRLAYIITHAALASEIQTP